jgi:hypothetical protein
MQNKAVICSLDRIRLKIFGRRHLRASGGEQSRVTAGIRKVVT